VKAYQHQDVADRGVGEDEEKYRGDQVGKGAYEPLKQGALDKANQVDAEML
jgi:hypothetical protein